MDFFQVYWEGLFTTDAEPAEYSFYSLFSVPSAPQR